MFLRLLWPPLLLAVIGLTACHPLALTATQRREAVDDFIYALRWQRLDEAAAFFAEEQRSLFLEQLGARHDLKITDVRLLRYQPDADGRSVSVELEVAYFTLTSATLHTKRLPLRWDELASGGLAPPPFRIVTPFPPLP